MAAPPCPQPQDFSVLSGFMVPRSDAAPDMLDASITVDVLDPTEADATVRVVEVTDPFRVVVDWCICGRMAADVGGCWNVSLYLNSIDGVAPTHGQLGTTEHVQVDSVPVTMEPTESSRRCYSLPFVFSAGTVGAGVYSLVVIVTISVGSIASPGPLVQDLLGYAQIPALVFSQR